MTQWNYAYYSLFNLGSVVCDKGPVGHYNFDVNTTGSVETECLNHVRLYGIFWFIDFQGNYFSFTVVERTVFLWLECKHYLIAVFK